VRGDDFREDVIGRIADTALFHDPSLPPGRPTVFSDLPSDTRDRAVRRFTFLDSAPRDRGLVRWVRTLHPGLHDRDDAKAFVQAVVGVLAGKHLLLATATAGGTAYQLHEDAVRVVARTDGRGRRCPKCRTRWQFHADRSCPQCSQDMQHARQVPTASDGPPASGTHSLLAACRSILNRILQAAEDERLIPFNPVRKVEPPKPPVDPEVVFGRIRRCTFTSEEFASFLAVCPVFYRDHFLTQVSTGLRSGELLGLRAGRVDLERRRIEVVDVRYDAGKFGAGYKNRPKPTRASGPCRWLGRSPLPSRDGSSAARRTGSCSAGHAAATASPEGRGLGCRSATTGASTSGPLLGRC
jgi:ssDNA-binding Zn-finger/Zn-ribbon topoisomerase 1